MDALRKPQTDFLNPAGTPGDHATPATTAPPLRVWVVDDNDAFRGLLAGELQRREGIECSRQFPCAISALRALAVEPAPDVVLLDVHLRGASGLDAIAPMKTVARTTRVLMLTTFFDHRAERVALRAGAVGFLLKSYSCSRIVEAVREAGGIQPLPAAAPVEAEVARTAAPEFIPLLERGVRLLRGLLRQRGGATSAVPGTN